MLKRKKIILLFAATALALTWLILHDREPSYHGHTLREWADDIYARNFPNDEAATAIRRIGADAFPFVLRSVEYDGPIRSKFSGKLPAFLKRPYDRWMDERNQRRSADATRATHIIRILGKDAAPLTPGLLSRVPPTQVKMHERMPHYPYRWGGSPHVLLYHPTITGLSTIGTNALPYFRPIIHDPGHPSHSTVLYFMWKTTMDGPGYTFPSFVEELAGKDINVVVWRTWTLRILWAPCNDVREALQKNLTNANEIVRESAADTLRVLCSDCPTNLPTASPH